MRTKSSYFYFEQTPSK